MQFRENLSTSEFWANRLILILQAELTFIPFLQISKKIFQLFKENYFGYQNTRTYFRYLK